MAPESRIRAWCQNSEVLPYATTERKTTDVIRRELRLLR